jgi:hypothetical protein
MEPGKQQGDPVFVRGIGTGVAGGKRTGGAAQILDLQARIVGKSEQAGPPGGGQGFQGSVFLKGLPGLGDIDANAEISRRDELERNVPEQVAVLAYLTPVIGGQQELRSGIYQTTSALITLNVSFNLPPQLNTRCPAAP